MLMLLLLLLLSPAIPITALNPRAALPANAGTTTALRLRLMSTTTLDHPVGSGAPPSAADVEVADVAVDEDGNGVLVAAAALQGDQAREEPALRHARRPLHNNYV